MILRPSPRPRPSRRARLETLEPRTMLTASGALDPSFGGGFGYLLDPTIQPGPVGMIAEQADGKLVLATGVTGNATSGAIDLLRLGLDGEPDPTFGTAGRLTTASLPGIRSIANLIVQPDGKFLVTASNAPQYESASTYFVARFNADGSTDTGFGTGGEAAITPITVAAGPTSGLLPTQFGGTILQPTGQVDMLFLEAASAGSTTLSEVIHQLTAGGTVDATYGTAGRAALPFAGVLATYQSTGTIAFARQADGKLVIDAPYRSTSTNPTEQQAALTRLNTDGSVDTGFGAGGIARAPVGQVRDVDGFAIQADGKFLLEGTDGTASLALTRLDADGSLDAGFGDGTPGLATLSKSIGYGGALVAQADGGILVVGGSAAYRLLDSGKPDPAFGDGATPGLAAYRLGNSTFTDLTEAFVEPDGSALLVGTTEFNRATSSDRGGEVMIPILARILLPHPATIATPPAGPSPPPAFTPISPPTISAGRLDANYGGGTGLVSTDTGTPLFSLSVTGSDSKTYVVGKSANFILAARFNPDNTIDPGFKDVGLTLGNNSGSDPSGPGLDLGALALGPDGKLVVAGTELVGDSIVVFVGRFDDDGTPDPGFGTGGVATFTIGSTAAGSLAPLIGAIDFQADGKILLAGEAASPSGALDLAAIRLDSTGKLDPTFGGGGVATVAVPGGIDPAAMGFGVKALTDGQVLVAGTGRQIPAGGPIRDNGFFSGIYRDVIVARLDADGTLDARFGADSGLAIVGVHPNDPTLAGSFVFESMALESNGDTVVEGTTPAGVALARITGTGAVDAGFGSNGDGRATLALPAGASFVTGGAFAIQGDLKILLGGYYSGTNSLATARLTAGGTPDPTYGNSSVTGLATYPFPLNGPTDGTFSLRIVAGDAAVLADNHQVGLNHFGAYADQLTVAKIILVPTSAPTPTKPTPRPTPAVLLPPGDFDGSGRTNFATYYATAGAFLTQPSAGGPVVTTPFGVAGPGQSIPAPGDYSGSGRTDLAVYIPGQGVYAIRPASGADIVVPFGIPGAGQSIPAPGDYEKSGRDDIAVYLPSIGAFGIRPASDPSGSSDKIIPFGVPGTGQSLPAPADYFGTGQDDIAVYLASIGAFAIRDPRGGPDVIVPFGLPGVGGSIPVPGDYDGSGHVELAVYMPSIGTFAYRPYGGGPDVIEAFGTAGDGSVPVPGDYTGSGHLEIAVYDPNYAAFAYRPAGGGGDMVQVFGTTDLATSLPAAAPAGAISGGIRTLAAASVATPEASVGRTITAAARTPDLKAASSFSTRRSPRTPVAQAQGGQADHRAG